MKKFCIIAVDYENHVPRGNEAPSIQKGLESLSNQTFKNFNLIICHDGPKTKTYEEEGIDFKKLKLNPILLNTEQRMNDWGHSSRDLAMRYAYENNLGEYYVQFNIDNLLRADALEWIKNETEENIEKVFIFSINHHKLKRFLSGLPPVRYRIDALQLVAHKDIWKKYNFWYDKHPESDGKIYQKICNENDYKHISQILGDNF